jgi:hypothetical protein
VGYCYPSRLEKTLCKCGIYVSLVTEGLKRILCKVTTVYTYCIVINFFISMYFSHLTFFE